MKNKVCSKCLTNKELSEFSKVKKNYDGFHTKCKECVKIVRRLYYNKNKKNITQKQKKYSFNNIEKTRAYVKKWQNKNKDTTKIKNKLYRINNPEKIAKLKKEWNSKNKEKIQNQQKEYYKKNKEKILNKNREWNKKYSHIVTWRSILKSHLRRIDKKKENKTIDLLGYSATELKIYLESLFTDGMSWNNHGEWEIDHIKPVTAFNIDELPSIVNALNNLQPLWKKDNRQKYNKYEK